MDLNLSGPIAASRENFSLRVFSQLKLKEIKQYTDVPSDLFTKPINMTVVKDSGKVTSYDDTAIQRITYGSVLKSSFSNKLTNQTGPRRPDDNKYFIGSKAFVTPSETSQKLASLTSTTVVENQSVTNSDTNCSNNILTKNENQDEGNISTSLNTSGSSDTSRSIYATNSNSTNSIGNTYKSKRYTSSLSSIFEPPPATATPIYTEHSSTSISSMKQTKATTSTSILRKTEQPIPVSKSVPMSMTVPTTGVSDLSGVGKVPTTNVSYPVISKSVNKVSFTEVKNMFIKPTNTTSTTLLKTDVLPSRCTVYDHTDDDQSHIYTIALSNIIKLKEIKQYTDVPSDLFTKPINMTVVKDSGKVTSYDDTAIQRITYGSVLKSPFSNKQSSSRTTPRRPEISDDCSTNCKYYLCQ